MGKVGDLGYGLRNLLDMDKSVWGEIIGEKGFTQRTIWSFIGFYRLWCPKVLVRTI